MSSINTVSNQIFGPWAGTQPEKTEEKGFFGKIGDAIKGLFSSTMGGQATGSTVGGIAGAALGLIGGPIGMMLGSTIGSMLGGALGGAIGRSNEKEQMQELMQQYQQAGANMQNFYMNSYASQYMGGGLGMGGGMYGMPGMMGMMPNMGMMGMQPMVPDSDGLYSFQNGAYDFQTSLGAPQMPTQGGGQTSALGPLTQQAIQDVSQNSTMAIAQQMMNNYLAAYGGSLGGVMSMFGGTEGLMQYYTNNMQQYAMPGFTMPQLPQQN